MTLSEELLWRGFINQTTLSDIKQLDDGPRTFYMGFDASADSQTVGNMAGMMFAKTFMRHGYEPIMLAGGSTSLIGDPGGKDKERPLQSEETIAHNVEQLKKQFKIVMKGYDFKLVNNLDWTRDMRVLPFLRDIGKHFSLTPLIQRDYIAQRLGESGNGISYAEFSYTILQGLDYLYLYDEYGCTLQLGGSDQWGNCLSGAELIRKARGKEVDVVTLNLIINKSTGKKFGKTEEGAVWLDPDKTSPYKFYQFWLNTDDESAEDYLKVFSELDKPTIDQIIAEQQEQPSARAAQKRLAFEVTNLVHGEERAESVKRLSEALFGGIDYQELEARDFAELEHELPVMKAKKGETSIVEALVITGLASSNTEARRFLSENAIYINGEQFSSQKTVLDQEDDLHGFVILRRGKNATALIKF